MNSQLSPLRDALGAVCVRRQPLEMLDRLVRTTGPWFISIALACIVFLSGQATGQAQTPSPSLPTGAQGEPASLSSLLRGPETNGFVEDVSGTFAPAAAAVPEADELKQLRERLAKLEEWVAASAKEASSKASSADSKPATQTSAGPKKDEDKAKKAEWVDVSSEKWTVKLGGHVQMDYVTWPDADAALPDPDNYFSFRRLRLVADGTGYGQFDFRLQMTLEPGSGSTDNIFATADVKDAYLSMNEIPGLGRLRLGNFFVPFSLEQVTNDTNNIFVERSIPTQGIFAADREVGIALYNHSPDESITWTTGLFFDSLDDTIKTRIDDNQGYRLSGRLTWLPYYDEPSNGRYLVHTGVAVLHTDDHDNLVRFRSRPQVQRGPVVIDSGILNADSYTTGGLEFAWVWGQFTLQSEAFLSTVALNTAPHATIGGAYAHVSYFLTGEARVFERFGQHGAQFARNKPFSNFFATPGGVGPGAWELKARWSNLTLSDLDRGEYNDFTFGANWYWSDRTRWMFDWIHPMTSSDSFLGETESDLLALRFDFNW